MVFDFYSVETRFEDNRALDLKILSDLPSSSRPISNVWKQNFCSLYYIPWSESENTKKNILFRFSFFFFFFGSIMNKVKKLKVQTTKKSIIFFVRPELTNNWYFTFTLKPRKICRFIRLRIKKKLYFFSKKDKNLRWWPMKHKMIAKMSLIQCFFNIFFSVGCAVVGI